MPALDLNMAWRKAIALCFLICCVLSQDVISDTITYKQMRQDYGGRSTTKVQPVRQGQEGVNNLPQIAIQQLPPDSDGEEFVRLGTGRIVDFKPGLLCDENCIEPLSSQAFGETGTNIWWIITPAAAGGVVCSVLCGSDGEDSQEKINIPAVRPDKPPTSTPPEEIPEPGTLLLVGLGLAMMVARKRHARNKIPEV
jgi:hypothetical protein